jgi:polar amino acid transport system substrate-binding protein
MRVRFTLALIALMMAAIAVVPPRLAATTLHFGADVSGAPFEYFPSGSKVPLGFDIDLIQAMMAKAGDRIVIDNHQFDDLLAAVRRGTFDAAISAMSDTSSREKQVNFLDYFVAGGGLMVRPGNPLRIFSIDGLCGYAVSVESGTSYETDLRRQSKSCKAVGLGEIKILTYKTDDDAFAAFMANKAPVYVADYPVSVWRARTSSQKGLEVVGRQFDVVPYGIAVSKQNAQLMATLKQALQEVIADGTYDRLLKKWGLNVGALRVAPVNAGILFEKP